MAARAGIEPAPQALPARCRSGTHAGRLVSLDAFRGFTMLLMILVNSSGPGAYHQLQHAEWNGWTLADTVFPSFLWIVGVAITLSLDRRLEQGTARQTLIAQIMRRAAILYALGLFIYLVPDFDWAHMRFSGVLQRIAICYAAAALLYLYSGIRGQIIWTAALLIGYWLVMKCIPVPGFGAGNLTLEGNLAHYIDGIVFGSHNWVLTKTWDPEGILSTAPAIATTLLGVLAGRLVQLKHPFVNRCISLFVAGICLTAAGLICSAWLPVNKNLWTSSFALLMAGLDCLIFPAFLWLLDGRGYRRWAQPLIIFGVNAIAVYLFSELVPDIILFLHTRVSGGSESLEQSVFNVTIFPPALLALCYALFFTAMVYAFAWLLYRKHWFFRV